MNVLIVHAHPEKKSFCSALKDTAKEYFENKGDAVVVSDLYEMNFQPTGGKSDFKDIENKDFFKYQMEQLNAFNKDLFDDVIKKEMLKIEAADLIIFNFPLWWFSLPAILKGWVDRVFAMGFCYGAGKGVYEKGVYRGKKKGMLCFTTGGPDFAYTDDGFNGDMNKILFHINHGMLYFVGMDALPYFTAFGPARKSDEERKEYLESYKKHLGNIDNIQPLY